MTAITSSRELSQGLIATLLLMTCLVLMVSTSRAQTGRVPTPTRGNYKANIAIQQKASTTQVNKFLQFDEHLDTKGPYDFGSIGLGLMGFQIIDISSVGKITNIDIKDSNDASPSPLFKAELGEKNCNSNPCLIVGFMPSDDHSVVHATLTITTDSGKTSVYALIGRGSAAACLPAKSLFFPLSRGMAVGADFPVPDGVPTEAAARLYKDFGDPLKKLLVNCFYSTNGLFSYFNQFQSIYNAASGSTTLNAQLGSLNFTNGMQITVGTNPQVGSSSSSSNPSTAVSVFRSFRSNAMPAASVSTIPTLSAASAAQAAQNVINGGTVYAEDLFPVFFKSSTYSVATLSTAIKEGVDLQKFNNTSITASNPPTHTFVGLEGYFQLTSSNDAANSSDPAGSIFLGGSYGYSLMNHSYSIQNGFGGRVNSQIAQVSAGILLNGVVKIAAYRGFGPSQSYIDSTSMAQRTVNNFRTWSIAISYQKSGAGKTK